MQSIQDKINASIGKIFRKLRLHTIDFEINLSTRKVLGAEAIGTGNIKKDRQKQHT